MKKFLSVILSLIIISGITTASTHTFADSTDVIKVLVNVTRYGEILKDKSDNVMALAEVELSGKETYNLDDVFKAVHDKYYDGGAESGYDSDVGDYGLYITEFWGDDSGRYSYQINSGTEAVTGLSQTIENGDIVDIAILKSLYPDTENYASFDKSTEEIYTSTSVELTLSSAGYDEDFNMVFSPCEAALITVNGEETDVKTDKSGKATIVFDTAGTYVVSALKSKTVEEETVTAITAPVCVVTVNEIPDACITVPSDATLFVGSKGKTHFVNFTEIKPSYILSDNENTKYCFELANNSTYNYRVSGADYVTYAGTFKKSADFTLDITADMLKPEEKSKNTVDRNSSSNNGYNTADIYLNINAKGHLKLCEDDTYQIVSLRNWEAVNNISANYFIEPDYHYEAIDENGNKSEIVEISESGLLTAKQSGTAIILVTYDAMTLNFGSGDNFYGAVYPENTGVFVVTVDSEDSEIETDININESMNTSEIKLSGDNLDSEHDYIYYIGDEGTFTFTPKTSDVEVYVANPLVDEKTTYSGFEQTEANADGSFTVPLTNGRNIVKVEKDGKAEYQVITAKEIDITVNNNEAVHTGDTLNIVFDKLYHPANKLAGVYNMNAIAIYTDVSGYDGQIIGAASAQYNFASNTSAQTISNILSEKDVWGVTNYVKSGDLVIPEDYPYDTFTLSGGKFYVSGWGDPYGNHRSITYENGKGANLNANAKTAYLGKLPDMEIPVTATTSELTSIILNTENAKTDYIAGERADTSGLEVTASYADGTTQIATNYTVSPEIITSDTTAITVTYRGKTAEYEVNVTTPKVTAIEITSPPAKTDYKVGNTFDPSGMVITAIYENGVRKTVQDYTYSPNRTLTKTDTEIIVTYIGSDKADEVNTLSIPITVKSSSNSSGTKSINVYFTLYGDENHGALENSDDIHTMTAGNLEKWIPKTKITLDKGSFVIDAVEKALSINGIPYTIEDNYISEVKGLSEFDNGNLSGWMYSLNGKYPKKGIDEQKLSNGDKIVLHYTDDYTIEEEYDLPKTSSSSGTKATYYNIKFNTDGGNSVISQSIEKNEKVIEPQKPEKEGYIFAGWFTDTELTSEYDFTTEVTKGFTLYAKWVKDTENEETKDTDNQDFAEGTFRDVSKDDWYYDAVKYSYNNKLLHGTDKGFEPDAVMTRAMVVTVIWRMENSPVSDGDITFEDVKSDDWYYDAVKWASDKKIVLGISNTVFSPDSEITREQFAAILYRHAISKKLDTSDYTDSSIEAYTDYQDVSDYASDAVKWAVNAGIIKGNDKNLLSPLYGTTRAEAATMLMRYREVLK